MWEQVAPRSFVLGDSRRSTWEEKEELPAPHRADEGALKGVHLHVHVQDADAGVQVQVKSARCRWEVQV